MPNTREAKDRMSEDMRTIVSDAQQLLSALGEDVDEKTQKARTRLEESLQEAKNQYDLTEERLRELGARQAQNADAMIRDYPYHALGISFGAGLLLGMLWKK
jgi:ElaB/YqjD/DUF883 family membrane-anchored ribosome-binding protein